MVIGDIAVEVKPIDFEETFRAQYAQVARLIARVVRDHARAEELAVDVFMKLWKQPGVVTESTGAWLHRTAVRRALDELRRRNRRLHYERILGFVQRVSTPEEIRAASEEQERVRRVLAALAPRHAELLLLRSHGFQYAELAAALRLNPASIGTLLSRAQQAFRKKYVGIYGNE